MQFLIKQFINYLEAVERSSKHTITSYQTDLIDFQKYILDQYELEDIKTISKDHIRSFIIFLFEKGVSKKTINRKISSLSSFFKYLLRTQIISTNPTQKIIRPKIPKKLASFIPELSLMQHIQSENNLGLTHDINKNTSKIYSSALESIIIYVLYATGIRRSELINLKLEDLYWEEKTIKILGKGNKVRLIPFPLVLQIEIKKYLEERSKKYLNSGINNLFLTNQGKPIYDKMVYNLVRKYLKKIPKLEKASPHILRHTFATHLSDFGADINAIKLLLGHSNLSATQIYLHNSPSKLKAIYEQKHPRS